MMQTGISTACFYPKTPEEALDFLCRHQISAAEVFINSGYELRPAYLQGQRQRLEENRVSVLSVHPFTSGMEPILFFSEYERRVEDGLEWYRHYFNAANELGASILVFHGDRRDSPCPDERYFERFLRLYELGQRFGVTVAQENVARCRSGSLDFLTKMAEALGERARFVLDVKQARRAGEDPMTMLRTLSRSVCHVHLSDGGEAGDCLPIGSGDMDMEGFFDLLRQQSYEGGVLLELYRQNYHDEEELLLSHEQMRQMAAGKNR